MWLLIQENDPGHEGCRQIHQSRYRLWRLSLQVDMLLVPTVLQNYLIAEVEAEEKARSPPTWDKNTLSGRFTNFVNLLDMAAISVPSAILRSPDLHAEAAKGGAERQSIDCPSAFGMTDFLPLLVLQPL